MKKLTGCDLRSMSSEQIAEIYNGMNTMEKARFIAERISAITVAASFSGGISFCVSYTISLAAKCR